MRIYKVLFYIAKDIIVKVKEIITGFNIFLYDMDSVFPAKKYSTRWFCLIYWKRHFDG